MVDFTVLPGFVAVLFLFLLPPGPDMAYMVAVGLESGRRAALAGILGLATGMSIYATAVVMGIARLAESHPSTLGAVKLIGAAYLVWLGWMTARKAREGHPAPGGSGSGRGNPYVRGVIVSLTNPKVILFFLAVLPQFMGTAQSPRLQLAMLGAVNVVGEVAVYGTIGVLAGAFHAKFIASPRAATMLSYTAAIVYLALAGLVVVDALEW